MSSTSGSTSPEHTHLGKSWEIAIVTVFAVLVVAIVAAMLFQARRKRRKLVQQEAEEASGRDVEVGKPNNNERAIPEEEVVAEEEEEEEEEEGEVDKVDEVVVPERERRKRMSEIRVAASTPDVPEAARLKDSTKPSTSSYHEYISKKPPKYYWNQR